MINEEAKEKEETTMKGYRNIALFGVDSREGQLDKKTRSDTIMIASINQDTGERKLASVYRDTYLNLGNDSYNKCNAAYAKGGPEQAINMLNMNLDMNITDFVTVGFAGLTDTIDALGGIQIDVHANEIQHLNNYQISMVGTTKDGETFTATAGTDYIPVTSAGLQTLNHCRQLHTAVSDMSEMTLKKQQDRDVC
ncbi:MAG: LCP family protein [Lachnospiraceae bacterium]